MWILTFECNDYYQQGAYFLAAFLEKPSSEELFRELVANRESEIQSEILVEHLLNKGGGRIKNEYVWYNLFEYEVS